MTVLLPALRPGTEQDTVCYVVVFPEGLLIVRHVAGGVDRRDDGDEPYQTGLWSAVTDDVDPRRRQVNGIALAGDLRAKVADAADAVPEAYPDNPVATAMLFALGGPARPRRGTIAIVAEEDPQTGLTGSLSAEQLDLIVEAHHSALRQASRHGSRR